MNAKEIISKYFNNELSPEEKVQFDGLMETNADFREQVEFESKVRNSIFQSEYGNLKKDLQQLEEELGKPKPTKMWYLVAASVVVLFAIGMFWYLQKDTPQTLFEEYYMVANNTTHPIVRSNGEQTEITAAFVAYENKDFALAQTMFANAYREMENSELLFYQGICYLEEGDYHLAERTLKEHQALNDRLFEKSGWYLALTLLKSNQKNNAIEILETIASDSTHYKFNEANELLSKL